MMTLGDLVSATDINVCKKRSNFLSGKGGWCEAAGNRLLTKLLNACPLTFNLEISPRF